MKRSNAGRRVVQAVTRKAGRKTKLEGSTNKGHSFHEDGTPVTPNTADDYVLREVATVGYIGLMALRDRSNWFKATVRRLVKSGVLEKVVDKETGAWIYVATK